MTMKILNRFIDDCVNVFQYRFMDTFQYFKERNKNKYLGDRFEEWVVKNSNISKDGCSDLDTGKIFWRLLDWRGDKYVEGYRPLSSSFLILRGQARWIIIRIFLSGRGTNP